MRLDTWIIPLYNKNMQEPHHFLKGKVRLHAGSEGAFCPSRWLLAALAIMAAALLFLVGVKGVQSYSALFVEIREMANITAIISLRNGIFNEVASFPGNIYLYGFLQAWLLSFLPEGCNLILANRMFSWGSLLLSDAVLVLAIRELLTRENIRMNKATGLIAASLYLLPHLFQIPTTLGTPNYLGLLLGNLILFLSIRGGRGNILLVPLLLTGCFMTKQYFLYSLIYSLMGIYVLHGKKHPWWEFPAICLLSGMGIALCFLSKETGYALQHHLNVRFGLLDNRQFLRRYALYLCFISPLLWLLCQGIFIRWRKRGWKGMFHNFSRPSLFALALWLASALVMLRMGRHCGAIGIMYFPQLMGTSSILLFGLLLGRLQRRHVAALTCSLMVAAMAGGMACLALRGVWAPSPYDAFVSAAKQDFDNPSLRVRGTSLSSYIELPVRGWVDDNGLTCYMEAVYPRKSRFWLGEYRERAAEAKAEYLSALKERVYDVIYLDPFSYCPQEAKELIEEGYECSCRWQFDPYVGVARYVRKAEP